MFDVRLDTVLRKLLSRVPTTSGATYIVRDNHIEITTGKALREEILGNSDRPLLPLVSARFNGLPLSDALRTLSEQTSFTITLDPRATEQGKTPLTTRLINVPVDTAVRLLADMAGLRSVQLDNVLYVTTPDNARTLEEEQAKRKDPARPEWR
jgi:type II secretory pathway component HofQ